MSSSPAKISPLGQPWVMLTAYDAVMATSIEDAGADLILVGDSLGRAVLGYDSEMEVTLGDMLHHGKAVLRARRSCPVIIDLPAKTYETPEQALLSAQAVMAIGADFVKIEGPLNDTITQLTQHNISVVAHLGYTPQTPVAGSKVVGKTLSSAESLLQECLDVEGAGAQMLVIEMVPREVAKVITEQLSIPVIGIGCGPDTDGQVLVSTDMWGDHDASFKFLKSFGNLKEQRTQACKAYADAVRSRRYPSDANAFHIKKSECETWLEQHDKT
jgi:3-methyl-2-oxobutanoate hydroxymethyltransferase